MATGDLSMLSKDTNAQESMNWDFKATLGQKSDIFGCISHAVGYLRNVEYDHNSVSRGSSVRYNRRQARKKANKANGGSQRYFNDGRPPDTTKDLVPRSRSGRPKGSLNKVPCCQKKFNNPQLAEYCSEYWRK
ncbi:hypothetical protein BGX28_002217 [Mortierella sp. GBA30]|nr:hypothetical protein BGX28_002217 [Mortierella sp. GBA30]